jgi:hypothetical protein
VHSGGEWLSSPPSENWMTRKRKRHIGEFAEKHHISISVDWLLDGDLEGRLRIPAMTWPSAGGASMKRRRRLMRRRKPAATGSACGTAQAVMVS